MLCHLPFYGMIGLYPLLPLSKYQSSRPEKSNSSITFSWYRLDRRLVSSIRRTEVNFLLPYFKKIVIIISFKHWSITPPPIKGLGLQLTREVLTSYKSMLLPCVSFLTHTRGMWRSQKVQAIVTNKAHRMGMRISHICVWGTSMYAYDGSGTVQRGEEAGLGTYSMCRFPNGKVINCDLSVSYNIGARYFIREILKSLPETARLHMEAEVPQCCKRSTCTFSTLISLHAALMSA